jgi:hypothetical protein
MKILVIGSGKKAEAVEAQMMMAGHAVGRSQEPLVAAATLRNSSYDLVLLVDCNKLEETDLVAEALKHAAMAGPSIAPPYVFVLWDAMFGYEPASAYGMKAIDILMENFSPKRCEQAYQYTRHNAM